MKKKIKLSLFWIFGVLQILSYVALPGFAQAGSCSFALNVNNPSPVAYSGNASFNLSVVAVGSGNNSDCQSITSGAVYFALFWKTSSSPIVFNISNVQSSKQANLDSSNKASVTFNLGPYDSYTLQKMPTPNRLDFQIVAYAKNGGNMLAKTDIVSVTVTGVGGFNLNLPVNVSFSNQRAIYGNGDKTDVIATVSDKSSAINGAGINNADMYVYVNNGAEPIAKVSVVGAQQTLLKGGAWYQGLIINSANGFQGGSDPTPNTVTVKLFQAGTNNKIGEGNATIQVQGQNIGLPTVGVNGGAKSQYAVGESVILTAQNIPSDAIVEIDKDNQAYKKISGNQANNFAIPINADFSTTQSSTLDVIVTAADGSLIYKGHLVGPFTVGAGSVGGPGTTPPSDTTPPVDCTGPDPNPNFCIYNPLPVNTLTDTLLLIMRGFLGILALWSVAFIVIGGFRYVMSQGNEEAVTTARKTITWAIVGLAIAMLAFSIIAIVQYLLGTQVQNVSTSTGMVTELRKIGMSEKSDMSEVG